jgi:hypothetical protein
MRRGAPVAGRPIYVFRSMRAQANQVGLDYVDSARFASPAAHDVPVRDPCPDPIEYRPPLAVETVTYGKKLGQGGYPAVLG